ncbi:PhaM family polyhydroxyalkanoate granule multifunctional regulatory protein [Hydrogenophaga sp. PAMC20947]|uniref:PhaM family polyhydroxyalkanoate granule multifunctional regulatory protein n=1 Tax=Hydrogenophaga sp. PAMC20947 TaxID=2565558 RepID=UPI001B353568|nr:PhaM family polyhydroxyalkanoate granule multifunctional regulatory protein [Hydrogenophaga sp. PAMC20947]
MSDTSGSGFGKFVPGFEFLQSLAGQAAGGMAQGLGNSLPQLPNLSHWVAPTVNVEDLEKRIEELKAVHFWLDQNTKALSATIQALEVQKMTLATLHQMNFSLGDVANALKIKAAETVSSFTGQPPAPPPTTTFAGLEVPPRTYGLPPAPMPFEAAPAPVPAPVASAPSMAPDGATAKAGPQGGVVDPVQWWGALSQQFQNIAANAMKDVAKQTTLDTTRHVASGLTEQAVKTATGVAGKVTGTVARNVGMAAGMGKAAARAVTGSGATKPAQPAPKVKAKEKPRTRATPKVASKSAPKAATAQPLSMGDWPLPAVFFPGFQAPATAPKPARKSASAPVPRPAGKKSVGSARKKPAAKAASGRRASKS